MSILQLVVGGPTTGGQCPPYNYNYCLVVGSAHPLRATLGRQLHLAVIAQHKAQGLGALLGGM